MKNAEELVAAPAGIPGPDGPPAASPVAGADADASTRHRVSSSILEHGPSTAAELAERLGLTPAAIRRHLDVLLAAGHVEARDQRVYGARGRGRPAKDFALTDAGRAVFYTAYDALAIQALAFLADSAGPGAVTRFAESRLEPVEARYRARLDAAQHQAVQHQAAQHQAVQHQAVQHQAVQHQATPAQATPAQALADALTADGYVASILPSANGEQLCQHHCPVSHVAEQFPQLCEAEAAAFSRLLGVHVQRLATIAHGDGVCTTHIPRASGTTHIPSASGTTHIPRASGTTHIPRASGTSSIPRAPGTSSIPRAPGTSSSPSSTASHQEGASI